MVSWIVKVFDVGERWMHCLNQVVFRDFPGHPAFFLPQWKIPIRFRDVSSVGLL